MTLLSDFQARFSTAQRTEWSNPQNSSATTPNTTQETNAAADAGADFAASCGVAYDSSIAAHVAVGPLFLIQRLKLYTAQTTVEQWLQWIEAAKKHFAVVLGRNRISPTTDSTARPSRPDGGARPFADIKVFDRYIPKSPSGGGDRTFRD